MHSFSETKSTKFILKDVLSVLKLPFYYDPHNQSNLFDRCFSASTYDCLEKRGDALMHGFVDDFLQEKRKDNTEQKQTDAEWITDRERHLSCTAAFSFFAKQLGLHNHAIQTNPRQNTDKLYEDIFEAFVGALFEDYSGHLKGDKGLAWSTINTAIQQTLLEPYLLTYKPHPVASLKLVWEQSRNASLSPTINKNILFICIEMKKKGEYISTLTYGKTSFKEPNLSPDPYSSLQALLRFAISKDTTCPSTSLLNTYDTQLLMRISFDCEEKKRLKDNVNNFIAAFHSPALCKRSTFVSCSSKSKKHAKELLCGKIKSHLEQ